MNIFLSHASEQRAEADRLTLALQARGHDVFLDTDDLPAGSDYQSRIQTAIDRCDIFCFLISPDSVRQGRFTLSEIGFARRRFPNPVGRVLPIMVAKVPMDAVPPYLRAVSILEPQGDFVADSLVALESLRPREWWRTPKALAGAALAVVVVLAVGGFLLFRPVPDVIDGPADTEAAGRQTRGTAGETAGPSDTKGGAPSGVEGAVRMPMATELEAATRQFSTYLKGLGFTGTDEGVTVYLYSKDLPLPAGISADSQTINGFYTDGRLFLHTALMNDRSVLFRGYTHHALELSAGGTMPMDTAAGVESGLADYFPVSFLNTPLFGAGVGRVMGLDTDYVRRLDNTLTIGTVSKEMHDRGEVWGGALWACRQDVGQATIDKAAADAWLSTMNPKAPRTAAAFGRKLSGAPGSAGQCLTQQLRRRGLPH